MNERREICGAAILSRLLRAELESHDRRGSTRVFCFLVLCVFVGKVAFSLPRQALVFSFFSVCRRLVVFSLRFLLHCNNLSGVLCGFFFLKSYGSWLSSVGFAIRHFFRSRFGGNVGFQTGKR